MRTQEIQKEPIICIGCFQQEARFLYTCGCLICKSCFKPRQPMCPICQQQISQIHDLNSRKCLNINRIITDDGYFVRAFNQSVMIRTKYLNAKILKAEIQYQQYHRALMTLVEENPILQRIIFESIPDFGSAKKSKKQEVQNKQRRIDKAPQINHRQSQIREKQRNRYQKVQTYSESQYGEKLQKRGKTKYYVQQKPQRIKQNKSRRSQTSQLSGDYAVGYKKSYKESKNIKPTQNNYNYQPNKNISLENKKRVKNSYVTERDNYHNKYPSTRSFHRQHEPYTTVEYDDNISSSRRNPKIFNSYASSDTCGSQINYGIQKEQERKGQRRKYY